MMLCFVGPALALLVLLLFLKRRHHHHSHFMPAYGYAGCGPGMDLGFHHGHGHGHGFSGGMRRGRGLVRAVFTRLDTTPGQEKVIVKALDTLWEPRGRNTPTDDQRVAKAAAVGGIDNAAVGGVGLGLYLVRRVALAHHGEAFAENRERGGARVGFTLRNG